MKAGVCHYSFRRAWKAEDWDCRRLIHEAEKMGAYSIDLQVNMLGNFETELPVIRKALQETGLTLAAIMIPKDLRFESDREIKQNLDKTKAWLHFALELGSPLARVFADYGRIGKDEESYQKKLVRAKEWLYEVVQTAAQLGIVIALENRGRFPWTSQYHSDLIRSFNSPFLKACVDIANYRACGEQPEVATASMAPLAAYVQFKDYTMLPDGSGSVYERMRACALGEGEVRLDVCVRALEEAGYDGIVTVEYEGSDPELEAVHRSMKYLFNLLNQAEGGKCK
jgi:sugar phosphate isomerase/epimerase